jgi:hypothetical protein
VLSTFRQQAGPETAGQYRMRSGFVVGTAKIRGIGVIAIERGATVRIRKMAVVGMMALSMLCLAPAADAYAGSGGQPGGGVSAEPAGCGPAGVDLYRDANQSGPILASMVDCQDGISVPVGVSSYRSDSTRIYCLWVTSRYDGHRTGINIWPGASGNVPYEFNDRAFHLGEFEC